MIRTSTQPLHDWRRSYRLPRQLARELSPELLALRTRRLVADLREKYGCSESTAMKAVGIARRAA